MNTNEYVTISHFDEKTQEEEISYFGRANVHGNIKIGDLSHGRRQENGFTVRIPTKDTILVSCGDRISCDKFPHPLSVVGFADNRRGSHFSKHYKLLVK